MSNSGGGEGAHHLSRPVEERARASLVAHAVARVATCAPLGIGLLPPPPLPAVDDAGFLEAAAAALALACSFADGALTALPPPPPCTCLTPALWRWWWWAPKNAVASDGPFLSGERWRADCISRASSSDERRYAISSSDQPAR